MYTDGDVLHSISMSFTSGSSGGRYNVPGLLGTGVAYGLYVDHVSYGGKIPALYDQHDAEEIINLSNIQPYTTCYRWKRIA